MFQIQWLWHNLKGYRKIYIAALVLSLACNALYLTTPYFSSKIVDTYITGENAAANLQADKHGFIMLLVGMIGFTLLRTVCQYSCNMTYEISSQGMIYKIRNRLFQRVQRQDMDFYDKNRTGDLMTRLTGDLDMVRHAVSWVFKGIVESLSLFTASMVYFFIINWKMALMLFAVTPFIFVITVMFKKVAGPVYVELREKLSKLNTDAQENISGNRVVKAFAREDFEIEKFGKANREYSEANNVAEIFAVYGNAGERAFGSDAAGRRYLPYKGQPYYGSVHSYLGTYLGYIEPRKKFGYVRQRPSALYGFRHEDNRDILLSAEDSRPRRCRGY